jgi:signal transduction histidine kinase
VAASGVERAQRFIVILLALQRLSYLIPALLSLRSGAFHSAALNAVLVTATIAWNVVLFWRVNEHGWFIPPLVWIDVGWTVVLVLAVTANSGTSYEHSSVNWSGRMGQAAAALAGAAIARLGLAALGVAVLLAAHTVATVGAVEESSELPGYLTSCLNGLLWFAVIIGFAVRYLRRQGSLLDRLTAEGMAAQQRQAQAQARQAADQARYSARLAHYRALHDTVLSTLSAIARGGLDHRGEQVRGRCARDADYVRRLMVEDDAADAGTVGDALGHVVTDAEALGLRVHYRLDALPAEVPADVAEALGGATKEALNNVARHSGTQTAWVTATGADDAVVVRVVDRGHGFGHELDRLLADPVAAGGPAQLGGGFGLPWSVSHRMRAVGGSARVSSAPGDGTCVELRWPA